MAYTSSSFSRIKENEAKMGAYYTDIAHCKDIRNLFVFPEDKEVCVLEPSIADGRAVIAVTGAEQNTNIKIFGVELNDVVAKNTKCNPYITDVLIADFTNEVIIRKNCFSFAFGNPPYLTEKNESGDKNIRLEKVFLDKIVNYLKIGAILVWVIPYHAFCESSYLRMWMRDFDTEAIYKFREPEYSKYHQIVIVGRKVHRRVNLNNQVEAFTQHWNLGSLQELPNNLLPHILVYPSSESDVDIFTTKIFDENAAYHYLEQGIPDDIKKAFDKRAAQKQYSGGKLKQPPIALKKDLKYLLVTSGFSDGIIGSDVTDDTHMMRGVANVTEHTYCSDSGEDECAKPTTVTITSSTEAELRIIENDGTITLLQ